MFEVSHLWKSKSSELLRALFERPERQGYRFVELSLNVQLFHVDASVTVAGENYATRFIFDNFGDISELIVGQDFENVKISMQTKREDAIDYSFDVIEEVFESDSSPGTYLYRCKNNVVKMDMIYDTLLPFDDGILV